MVEFNEKQKKIIVKIVYYGPALSGKTTNLIHLHNLLRVENCGDLMSLETKGDRTLFFDLLPFVIKTEKYKVKIKVYTVPGQVNHDATRKAVLSRADGVVFVADSQTSQTKNNYESFTNLEENACRVGLDFNKIPLVIQYNKQDLDDIIKPDEILETWENARLPVLFSSALYGEGVRDTFLKILKRTYDVLNKQHELDSRYMIRWKNFIPEISE